MCSEESFPLQVYTFVEQVTTRITRNQCTALIFLAIEKAFDKAGNIGLIHKLSVLYHLPPTLFNLIFSYLKDKYILFKSKNLKSQQFFYVFGVPQGVKVSLKKYLFINDVPQHIHTHLAKFAEILMFFRRKATGVLEL